jgi:two-component system, NtrC family, nitrogen regulation sensor histidine kinase NtrY
MFVFNDLVSSVANLFSHPEDDKEIEFSLNIPDERYTVYADRSLLVNALNNLVKNAIQAIPHDRKGRVSVSLYRRNSVAIVRISDNGMGIPKDIQDKIFSPNFSTKAYGSGIGLLITKNIIQSVNGKIYFESVENEGTEFYVELEIQEIEEPQHAENGENSKDVL